MSESLNAALEPTNSTGSKTSVFLKPSSFTQLLTSESSSPSPSPPPVLPSAIPSMIASPPVLPFTSPSPRQPVISSSPIPQPIVITQVVTRQIIVMETQLPEVNATILSTNSSPNNTSSENEAISADASLALNIIGGLLGAILVVVIISWFLKAKDSRLNSVKSDIENVKNEDADKDTEEFSTITRSKIIAVSDNLDRKESIESKRFI